MVEKKYSTTLMKKKILKKRLFNVLIRRGNEMNIFFLHIKQASKKNQFYSGSSTYFLKL